MDPKHFESLYPENSREQEIHEIVSYIREGNSCQLIGVPGVGRSNIFGLLTHNKEIRLKHFPTTHDYIHVVNINFSEARKRPLVEVLKLLFLSLSESLRERGMKEEYAHLTDTLKESLAFQDEMVMSQGLRLAVEYLSVEKKMTLIFLFDRFEEYIPYATPEFFSHLRLLRNKAKYRFSIVFSLPRPLEDIVDPSLMIDFYELIAGHFVFVRLHDSVGLEFRKNYIEKMTGKMVENKDFKEILELMGGHSRLTRLSIEAVLTNDKQLTTNNLKKDLLQRSTMRNALLEIWESLAPSEQEYLSHTVAHRAKKSIEQRVNEKEEADNQDDDAKKYLEKVGLLENGRCILPLLLDYAEDSSRIAMTEKATLRYDEATNSIKRGKMTVSDSLTKSEFRLLKHFLQNPDTVIERDDAIAVVWKESASTLGVTDQAVDQLVFRLRRKIEENPNDPQHILTVKGRGFKFTP